MYLSLELAFGLKRFGDFRPQHSARELLADRGCAILIPAHNERRGIGETVAAIKRSSPDIRVMVIADNCSDDTADQARAVGAEVHVRGDLANRGKGHALAFGRDCLKENPPAAVIIVDADCRLSPGSADRLALRTLQSGRPVQGVNLSVADLATSPMVAISNFAMLVKNRIRARGLSRLSGGALLFGTGMAFPWTLFERLELATSNAVEDLDLGLKLAREKIRVEFEDGAFVTSPPASMADSHGQRSRWEHGFLNAALRQGLPLMLLGVARRSRHLFFLGAHMLVPPLALFVIVGTVLIATIAGLSALSGSWLAFFTVCIVFGTAIFMLIIVWVIAGRRTISLRQLLKVPIYIVWKIPIYLTFFTRRQTGWNRTRREGEDL